MAKKAQNNQRKVRLVLYVGGEEKTIVRDIHIDVPEGTDSVALGAFATYDNKIETEADGPVNPDYRYRRVSLVSTWINQQSLKMKLRNVARVMSRDDKTFESAADLLSGAVDDVFGVLERDQLKKLNPEGEDIQHSETW